MIERLSRNVYALDVAVVGPAPEYLLPAACEPLEFIAGVESGAIELAFIYKLILGVAAAEPLLLQEQITQSRPVTREERERYLANYRRKCREGQSECRRLFFSRTDGLQIVEGAVVITEEFLKMILEDQKYNDRSGTSTLEVLT